MLNEIRRQLTKPEFSPRENSEESTRLEVASNHLSQSFIGTTHSFCATLLRERPIEFGVDPDFREIEEGVDQQLRADAWRQAILELKDSKPKSSLQCLEELSTDPELLRSSFESFVEYRDIRSWPNQHDPAFNLDRLRAKVEIYIKDMRRLSREFPTERGNDELMARYEVIVRASSRNLNSQRSFWRLLSYFDRSVKTVQKMWHSKEIAKQERDRFEAFREDDVKPAMEWLRQARYGYAIDVIEHAADNYAELKKGYGGLDFTDLLLQVAKGLRGNAVLRKYFRQRYTHLLVDEFQDTDPIQAELLLLLTSTDVDEQNWQNCKPVPGSLFVVGDPKQSIYRFRRGDIQTYLTVKQIFARHGQVVELQKNFRSSRELIDWNNRVYKPTFGDQADDKSPAYVQMHFADDSDRNEELRKSTANVLKGIYRLESATTAKRNFGIIQHECETLATLIRRALDNAWQVRRTPMEIARGKTPTVTPGDFLILPWRKKFMGHYRDALEKVGVPCEVTGANAYGQVAELKLLVDCLRAIDDPNNSIHYLSLCRDRLFGFSDAELFDFKQAGGKFRYTSSVPEELPEDLSRRIVEVNERLRRYQMWLRLLPFISATQRIAEDLGLLVAAGMKERGHVLVGSMLKAIEWIRARSQSFDTAADLIGSFDDLLLVSEAEGVSALTQSKDVVRIMNLHKAKGLEAPVVFLCDSTPHRERAVTFHIDRQNSSAAGYMCIREGLTEQQRKLNRKHGFERYKQRVLAAPSDWAEKEAEEKDFLDAEAKRLLYVATTRASSMLLVCKGADKSAWAPLHPFLKECPDVGTLISDEETPLPQEAPSVVNAKKSDSVEDPTLRWQNAQRPGYAIQSAKTVALKGSRPNWEASGDFGYLWGSVIHELLDLAIKNPRRDLRPSALRLAQEYGVETRRIDELLSTVAAVTKSDVWQRARNAKRCFSEFPFELETTGVSGDRTSKTGANGSDSKRNPEQLPTVLRGVMDLLFEEEGGWVIVDYKTDDVSSSDVSAAKSYYWPQLNTYAKQWSKMTGFKTKEVGLYFTRLNAYEPEFIK